MNNHYYHYFHHHSCHHLPFPAIDTPPHSLYNKEKSMENAKNSFHRSKGGCGRLYEPLSIPGGSAARGPDADNGRWRDYQAGGDGGGSDAVVTVLLLFVELPVIMFCYYCYCYRCLLLLFIPSFFVIIRWQWLVG